MEVSRGHRGPFFLAIKRINYTPKRNISGTEQGEPKGQMEKLML